MHKYDIIYVIIERGLGSIALTEKQQEKVQVCENNWIKRYVEVKRVEKKRWTIRDKGWSEEQF